MTLPEGMIPEDATDPRMERVRRETERKLGDVGPGWSGFEKAKKLYRYCFDGSRPWMRRAIACAALLYLISPIDGWPDWLPGGLLDDLAVLVYVAAQVLPDAKRVDAEPDGVGPAGA
jgi:uncharacterized membrane protein YkvA (DUF1232 family)